MIGRSAALRTTGWGALQPPRCVRCPKRGTVCIVFSVSVPMALLRPALSPPGRCAAF